MTQQNTLALAGATTQIPTPKTNGASLLRLMLPLPAFTWHGRNDAGRATVESYIADKFRGEYDANVTSFAPLLLSMRCSDALSAAVGIRPAQSSPLFIEQYLEERIEHCIQSTDYKLVRREEIAEIGNLVATCRGASQLLFLVIGAVLHEAGYRWLAFSATDKVERITRKFPFPVQVLCDSDPGRLGEQAGDWGRYYETSPRVIVGDLRTAYLKAQSNRLLRMVLKFYRPQLNRLVHSMPTAVQDGR